MIRKTSNTYKQIKLNIGMLTFDSASYWNFS